jgi:hypothetical protein
MRRLMKSLKVFFILTSVVFVSCSTKSDSWQTGKATTKLESLQWLVGHWNCERRQTGISPKVYDWLGKGESVLFYWDLKGHKLVGDYTGYYDGKTLLSKCFYGWVEAKSHAQPTCLGNSDSPAIVEEGTITSQGEPRFSGVLEIDQKPHTTTKNFVRLSDNKYEAQYFFRPVKAGQGQSFDQTISCQRKQ